MNLLKRQDGTSTIVALIWLVLILVVSVGWVLNLSQLIHLANTQLNHITLMMVLRTIGIFVIPLGAILGFFF